MGFTCLTAGTQLRKRLIAAARRHPLVVIAFSLPLALLGGPSTPPPAVVIHELAWSGTQASSNDEWIELRSNVNHDMSLLGWRLEAEDGAPVVTLHGTLPAQGYVLLERTDDHTVDDVPADVLFTGTLENSGEVLRLLDPEGRVVDSVDCGDGWFAGRTAPSYATMERVNPERSGVASNWRTNDGVTRNGCDAAGLPLSGTPKTSNSATKPPVAAFSTVPGDATIWDVLRFMDLSLDPDGQVVSWRWEFGDGAASTTQNPTHQYRNPGVYPAVLAVEDDDGLVARSARSIVVQCGRGDLNGDGCANLLDVRLALVCSRSGDSACGEVADIDQDGRVDMEDARRLAEFVLGL